MRRLPVVTDLSSILREDQTRAPLPTKAEALYVGPAGGRKGCHNCVLWLKITERCSIHKPDIRVESDHVCGYWIGGIPHTEKSPLTQVMFVTPELSGLMKVPGGTSCNRCRWSTRESTCQALQEGGKPAQIQALGCCSRWTAES